MKMSYQGRETEVQEIEVITSNEPWNEYQLADGSLIGLKTVLVSIKRAVDEKAPNGSPLYFVEAQNIIKVK